MSNNPFRGSIDLSNMTTLVYSEDGRVGGLLKRSLQSIGCRDVDVIGAVDDALRSIDEKPPRLVIIVSDLDDSVQLSSAHKINKKRSPTKGRTPKVLALVKPDVNDIMAAKNAGFFDVLPLPITPAALFNRLETVLTRLD